MKKITTETTLEEEAPAKVAKPNSKNYMQIEPYLHFNGNAKEAIEFYKSALKCEVSKLTKYSDSPDTPATEDWKDKIMHASLSIEGNCSIMLADDFQHNEGFVVGSNVHLSVYIESLSMGRHIWPIGG